MKKNISSYAFLILTTVVAIFLTSCSNNNYYYVEKIIEFDSTTGLNKYYESGKQTIIAENDSIAFNHAYDIFCKNIDSIANLVTTDDNQIKTNNSQSSPWQNKAILGFSLFDKDKREVLISNTPINEPIERLKDSLVDKVRSKAINYKSEQDSLRLIRKHIRDSINAKRWETSTSIDEMTGTENIWKSLTSDNTHHFDFPYEGGSTLKLTVRYMKKYGNDVILKISSGQVLCSEYNGTNYVNIRFDDEAPMRFYTNEPADYSSDHVFLNNPTKFINKAKKAKTIKVEIPIYEEGRPIFTFTVDEPLTWDK